jgi:Flp pilus assembly pilin Flp
MFARLENLCLRLRRFAHEDLGPTAVEYAVLLGLIIVVAAAAARAVGLSVEGLWAYIDTAVQPAG